MTLKEACEELQSLTQQRGDGMVTFARYRAVPPASGGTPVSELERKLEANGIIRFARQEFDSRTYNVVEKRLAAVLEADQ